MACLAIAISSTAYAQDDLLTRLVGGVANAIITKAGDKIEEHRKERERERQEKIKKDRQNPEYYAKVGTQTCHKATNIHEKYVTKLILAKDNAAYQKTLRSYYQDYADLFMASADKAADKSEVKAIIEIVNTVRNKTTSYEERKQITSDQEFQETISKLTQEIQKGCLSSMYRRYDETAKKRAFAYIPQDAKGLSGEWRRSTRLSQAEVRKYKKKWIVQEKFAYVAKKQYFCTRFCG